MGKSDWKKPVEYKETTVFELFPEYEYAKQQKARLVLFHDYAKHFKRIINYASHFDKPNQICMVYIVGEVADSSIQKALQAAQCSDRVWVLTSPFPVEELTFWNEFDKKRHNLQNNGMWDDEAQDINETWRYNHESLLAVRKYDVEDMPNMEGQIGLDAFHFSPEWAINANARHIQEDVELLAAIRHYRQLEKKAQSYFRHWTIHRIGQEPKPFYHKDIDRMVAKVYPYGVEANGINAYGSMSPAAIESAVKMVQTGEANKRFNFRVNPKCKAVKGIIAFIDSKISGKGYCRLSDIEEFVKSPPYGMSANGYSAAYLASAILNYPGKLFYYDSVCDFLVQSHIKQIVAYMLSTRSIYPSGQAIWQNSYIFVECTAHDVVRNALNALYGVDKSEIAGHIVNKARVVIESMFSLPISITDEFLYRMVGPELNWFDRGQVEELARDIERVGLPFLKWKLNLHQGRVNSLEIHHASQSAGWLWDRESELDSSYDFATREEWDEYDRLRKEDDALYEQLNKLQSQLREAVASQSSCAKQLGEAKDVLSKLRSEALKAKNDYDAKLKAICKERILDEEEEIRRLCMVWRANHA